MHSFFNYTYKCLLIILLLGNYRSLGQEPNNSRVLGNLPEQTIANTIKPSDTAQVMKQIRFVEDNILTLPYDSALHLLRQAGEQSKQSGYGKGVLLSLLDMGQVYTKKGMYQQSAAILYKAATYALGSDELRNMLPEIYSAMSMIYHTQGDYAKAAQYIYQAAIISEKLGNNSFSGAIYNNLGTVFIQMTQYPQARSYLDKAQVLATVNKDYPLLGQILINKGISYAYEKNYNASQQSFDSALSLAHNHKLQRIEHSVLLNMSNQALIKDDPDATIKYLQEVMDMHIHVDLYHDYAISSMLGEAYVKKHRYKEAETLLLKAAVETKKLNLKNNLQETYRVLTELYRDTKNYQKAFDYYDEYVSIKDSVTSNAIAQNVNLLDVRFRTAQKDKEIAEKKLLIAQQSQRIAIKNSLIISIAIGAIILTIAFIAIYRSYRHKTELEQLKASMAGEEKERNRIGQELHDGIGGMLTAIKMNLNTTRKLHPELMQIKNIDEIISMVQDTATEVRKTAHNMMPDVLLRYTLPEALLLYNEQINSGSDFKIDFHFYGDLSHIDRQLALSIYRIIQEFIQNIIKHAQASHAEIQVHRHDETVSITVEDNGVGFNNIQNGSKGLGLQNLKARVHALQGYISIESAGGKGTTAYIEFDLKKFQNTQRA